MVSWRKKLIRRLSGRRGRSKSMEEAAGTTSGIKPKHVAILKQAGISIDPYTRTSPDATRHIREQLYKGVLLENGTWATPIPRLYSTPLKFWVDRQKQKDCYLLYARALHVTSGDDTSYWRWHADDNDAECDVAELVRVMWLEVRGKFNTANLERNTKYRVSFIVKLRRDSDMKDLPLTVRLILPDRTQCENQRSVGKFEHWVELVAGEFSTSVGSTDGEMDICLEELGATWKSGLVVKGIELKPLY